LKGIEQEVTDREAVSAAWVNQAEGRKGTLVLRYAVTV